MQAAAIRAAANALAPMAATGAWNPAILPGSPGLRGYT
jgi:hypothetical protein